MLRFNAKGPEGLGDGKAPGQRSRLRDEHRRALGQMIETGPTSAIHGVVRWRLIDLAQWIYEEYAISVTKQILSRELRALGYRKLSARPRHHARDNEPVPGEAAVVDDVVVGCEDALRQPVLADEL